MNEQYPFVLPPLPYSYCSLEPYVSEEILHFHHDKHFKTYIEKLNALLVDRKNLQQLSLKQLICQKNSLPKEIATDICRNAGGVYNHDFYFHIMSPIKNQRPKGALSVAICACFGSYCEFMEKFKSAALSVFGSGYAWLITDKKGSLKIITTANQDTNIPIGGAKLLLCDVWEHAYYLQFKNNRSAHLDNWFQVVNWALAEDIFNKYVT